MDFKKSTLPKFCYEIYFYVYFMNPRAENINFADNYPSFWSNNTFIGVFYRMFFMRVLVFLCIVYTKHLGWRLVHAISNASPVPYSVSHFATIDFKHHWGRIRGAPPPKGINSLVLTYKFNENSHVGSCSYPNRLAPSVREILDSPLSMILQTFP